MNNLLKTTVYLILMSLASQLSAQDKILFVDKTQFVDSLKNVIKSKLN